MGDLKHTFCRLCEVMCGLEVTVDEGRVTKVRPDGDHPVSQGFACNKGLLTYDIHHDPDRLDHPMRREGADWQRMEWSEANAEIAGRLKDVIGRHGANSVAVYLGNPMAFNPLAGPAAAMFVLALGSGQVFTAATQDCANKFTVSEILYGSPDVHPVADWHHTDVALVVGSNPRVSKTSFLSTPDPVATLRRVTERGGTVTFVNPLRIEPDIGETVQLRPDTDVYLLAAMLAHIERRHGWTVHGYGDRVHNLEPLRAWVTQFSPQGVAPVVGVDAATIERLADQFATAKAASVHVSTGVNMGSQGSLAYYLAQMLSLVTGNFCRPGGNVAQARAVDPMAATAAPGADSFEDTPFGSVRRSKGSLPGALLGSWIRHPDHPIRALISVAGNPLLSLPGGDDLAAAFDELELLVSVDMYRNATAEHAHYVLPATDWFERPDLNTFTQGVQLTPHIQLTEALVEPRGARRHETEIFAGLSEAMEMTPIIPPGMDGLSMMYDAGLTAHGLSVNALAQRDRGLAVLEPLDQASWLDAVIRTPDARIDASPELLVGAMERASVLFATLSSEPDGQLRLITRRTRTTLNSSLANIAKLKQRGAANNPLWMHPDDAAERGLGEGDLAEVSGTTGSVVSPVAFDAALRPGVVAMTHGFGFRDNPGMPTARANPGVNVNAIAVSGPGSFEPLSGMCHLTGIPVDVHPAP